MSTIDLFPPLDREAYHADASRVGSTMLRTFLRSPVEYAARYVTRTISDSPPTAAMIFGTSAHLATLEPERFVAEVVAAPEGDRRTKEGREKWAAFQSTAADKIVLPSEDIARAKDIARALRGSAWWTTYVTDDQRLIVEWCHYWSEYETPCKALVDVVLPDAGIVADIKTTGDPTPEHFSAEIWRRGYHVQAAHYLAAAYNAFGSLFRFVILAVGKDAPYEVIPYAIRPLHLEATFAERAAALAEIARRHETGDWARSGGADAIVVELPRYLLKGFDTWD